MPDDGGIIRKEELFCAIVCSLYCCAGVALFLTGKAPVITESTDFFGLPRGAEAFGAEPEE